MEKWEKERYEREKYVEADLKEKLTAEAAGGYATGLLRIDGCKMCGHDTKTHFLEITEEGLIKIGKSL